MTYEITNAEFLQAIFGNDYQQAHVTGFAQPPEDCPRGAWMGQRFATWPVGEHPAHRDWNTFFCVSLFAGQRRRKGDFTGLHCVVIDDVGQGIGGKIDPARMATLPEPSWKLQTSPGSEQWGYILDVPLTDRGQAEGLIQGLIELGLTQDGADPGMAGVTRYMRLPVGSNTKKKYRIIDEGGVAHRLLDWRPERRWFARELAHAFGLTLPERGARVEPGRGQRETVSEAALMADPVIAALDRAGRVKWTRTEVSGVEIQCPWEHEHTQARDGTMAFVGGGFKCHHGHCQGRSGRDLRAWLMREGWLKGAVMPFEPVRERVEGDDLKTLLGRVTLAEGEALVGAVEAVMVALSRLDPALDAVRIEWVLGQLKAAGFGVVAMRRMLGALRRGEAGGGGGGGGEGAGGSRRRAVAWVDRNDEGRKQMTTANLEAILDAHGIRARYNQMNSAVELVDVATGRGLIVDREEGENLTLTYVRDLVTRYDLPVARVGEMLLSVARKHEYHPFKEYIRRAKVQWGAGARGESAWARLLSCIQWSGEGDGGVDGGVDGGGERVNVPRWYTQTLRRWLIQTVAAVYGHGGRGLRNVLVLQGPQAIGKTSFFRYLVPGGMFLEGAHVCVGDKDTVIRAVKHLVVELGEIGSTFRKSDVDQLKAFISNDVDVYREPYAARASSRVRRTVFCGTVNDSRFLRDATGSTRYQVCEVAGFDLDGLARMVEDGWMARLWAEVAGWYRDGEPWWLDGEGIRRQSWLNRRFRDWSAEGDLLLGALDWEVWPQLAARLGAGEEVKEVQWLNLRDTASLLGINPAAVAGMNNGTLRRLREAIEELTGYTAPVRRRRMREDGTVARERLWPLPPSRGSAEVRAMAAWAKARRMGAGTKAAPPGSVLDGVKGLEGLTEEQRRRLESIL